MSSAVARSCSAAAHAQGKVGRVHHRGTGVFKEPAQPHDRHALSQPSSSPEPLPDVLEVTAFTRRQQLMGIPPQDAADPRCAISPGEHPDGNMGKDLLANFLRMQ